MRVFHIFASICLCFMIAGCSRNDNADAVDTTLPENKIPDMEAKETTTAKGSKELKKTPSILSYSECEGLDCKVLSPDGWAGITVGMQLADLAQKTGLKVKPVGSYDEFFTDEPDRLFECNIYEIVGAPKTLGIFVQRGIITSISISKYEGGAEGFKTTKGVTIGDTEQKVRKSYSKLTEEPDIYSEPPDKKLFYYAPNGNGIKFGINEGKVSDISVGQDSIEYVEGCL